jgi:hypothetical protein
MPMPVTNDDELIATQLERIIHRVKQSMNYRGSYTTRDILGSLVARWLQSGEWERLKQLPPAQRHLGESVRRFILDRLDQLRRRGHREEIELDLIAVPDDAMLAELVEAAELRLWIAARVDDLTAGELDQRALIKPRKPVEIGRALRLHLDGMTQREIAAELGVSLGHVNKLLDEGTRYLILLQGIECGIA